MTHGPRKATWPFSEMFYSLTAEEGDLGFLLEMRWKDTGYGHHSKHREGGSPVMKPAHSRRQNQVQGLGQGEMGLKDLDARSPRIVASGGH